MSTSLQRYGFQPKIKQPELTVQEYSMLTSITDLMEKIDEHKNFWMATNSKTTISAISETKAVLLGLSQAVTSSDYRLERTALALYGKNMKQCIKAIRCPNTTDLKIKENIRNLRLIFKNGEYLNLLLLIFLKELTAVLHSLFELFSAANEEKLHEIANVGRKDLLEFVGQQEKSLDTTDVDEDLEDASSTMYS
jgi:hypothetical protein